MAFGQVGKKDKGKEYCYFKQKSSFISLVNINNHIFGKQN